MELSNHTMDSLKLEAKINPTSLSDIWPGFCLSDEEKKNARANSTPTD